MDGSLHFDATSHIYTKDGVRVPSVTRVLDRLSAHEYRFVTREALDDAAVLGTAAHKMIELDLRDDLDMDSLGNEMRMYYDAWRCFLATSGFQMLLSEQRVYSQRYGYAGTLDLFGTINGEAALIDAKRTAQVPRTAGPQTAAYECALREYQQDIVAAAVSGAGDGRIQRYALHLRKDGTWRLVPFTDKSDLRVFLACKTLNDWSNAA